MREVVLGEIAAINPSAGSVASDTPVSFVGMAELDAESAIAAPLETRAYGSVSKGYTVFHDGDILVAKITPCWENGKIGHARLVHDVGVGSTEFHVVRPGPDADTRFLLHFLRQRNVRDRGVGRMTGSAGQRRVPADFLQGLRIRLPPLEEQRRVVALLDQAGEVQAKRRRLLQHFDALIRSLFDAMFSSRDLPRVAFNDVIEYMRNGLSPSTAGTVPGTVLTLSAITHGTFDARASKQAMFDREPSEKVRVNASDFLICRGNGNVNLVGVGVHPDTSHPALVFPDTVIAARVDADRVDLQFLEVAWKQAEVRAQIESGARTTNGTHKVNQRTIGAIEFGLPSKREQTDFAEKASRVKEQRGRVAAALGLGDELLDKLRADAFQSGT